MLTPNDILGKTGSKYASEQSQQPHYTIGVVVG